MKPVRILIVEDDPGMARRLKAGLSNAGFEAVTAPDGRSGLNLYRAGRHDLVITDIIMPDFEGIETILAIRGFDADARIIAISGGGRIGPDDFLRLARSLGADEVLAKPFRLAELVTAATRVLGQSPAAPRQAA